MNQTNNIIREEWREQIEIWKDTPSPENEGEATEIVTNWWLSKIDELLKSQRAELVEKVSNFFKEEYGYKGKFIEPDTSKKSHGTCCYCGECGYEHDDCVCENNRIYKLLSNLSPNKENKEYNNSSVKIDAPKPPFSGLHYQG